MNKFLAKTYKQETIIEHTRNLIRNFYIIKKLYPNIKVNWKLLYLACLYHDLGKMNTKFQNKIMEKLNNEKSIFELIDDILKNIEEIPHGYISPAFLPLVKLREEFNEEEIRILTEVIAYHHNREKLESQKRKNDLKKVIEEDISRFYNDLEFFEVGRIEKLETNYIKKLGMRILLDKSVSDEIKSKFIITKGLLNKIDFAASSETIVEVDGVDLKVLTEKSIKRFGMNELQKYMYENQNRNVVAIASTGIGKTEGSLIWIGKDKGFFTLPLKVSINAIYDRIIDPKKINCPKDKVGLLHSDTASEYMKRDIEKELDEGYLNSTKQLCMPITVCTIDQLIDFIFKFEGFELKLATLSYSKIVIDEIQTYSPRLVAYLLYALKEIAKAGGRFAIVTATFPPIFEAFMKKLGLIKGENFVKSDKPFLKEVNGEVMLRHKVKVHKEIIDNEIDLILSDKSKRKLIICNTVFKAQAMYEELNNKGANVHTFHARFTREDRANKEAEIFRDGQLEWENNNPNEFEGIWITTQVVEASLDIDFDILFTELSDLAGLLQRMGRAYRNRILNNENHNIHVFVGNNKTLPSGVSENGGIIDYTIFNKSKECILKYDNRKLDEAEKMKIIEEVYSIENLGKSNYAKEINKALNDIKSLDYYDLKKNEERLRTIDSSIIIPESIYHNENSNIDEDIELLKTKLAYRERIKIKDKIMAKTISIPTSNIEKIKKKGGIINEIFISEYEKIFVIPCEYSYEKGLIHKDKYENFSENQYL